MSTQHAPLIAGSHAERLSQQCLCSFPTHSSTKPQCAPSWAFQPRIRDVSGDVEVEMAACLCVAAAARLIPSFLVSSFVEQLCHPGGNQDVTIADSAVCLSLLPTTRGVWQAAVLGYDVMVVPESPGSTSGVSGLRVCCADMIHDAIIPSVDTIRRCISMSKDGPAAPSSVQRHPPPSYVASVAQGKVDQWLGVLWSLGVHVTKQPMLEHHCGPSALVLCATLDQCDEVAWLLEPVAKKLNLVVHNMVDAFPLMPENRRADIVVALPMMVCYHFPMSSPFGSGGDSARSFPAATPPSHASSVGKVVDSSGWMMFPQHKVSALANFQRTMGFSVPPFGGPNITQGAMANRKKYQLDGVSQLAIMDVDGILRTGQVPFVDAIVGSTLNDPRQSTPLPWGSTYTRGIKRDAQWYLVGITEETADEAALRWMKIHREAKGVRSDERPPLACITIISASGVTPPDGSTDGEAVEPQAKRPRIEVARGSHVEDEEHDPSDMTLVLRNCVSFAQLVRDPEMLRDVVNEILAAVPDSDHGGLTIRLGFLSPNNPPPPATVGSNGELVILLSRKLVDEKTRCPIERERVRGSLGAVASALRGQLLEGNPVLPIMLSSAAIEKCPTGGKMSGIESIVVAVFAKAASGIDNICVCDPVTSCALRWHVKPQVLLDEEQQLALLADSTAASAATIASDCGMRSGSGRCIDRCFPPCTTLRHLLDTARWLCGGTDHWLVWNASVLQGTNCTIVIRGIGGPTVQDVVMRPMTAHGSADGGRSVLEGLLAQCQTVGLVKSFLVHNDGTLRAAHSSDVVVSLFVEYWTLAAAQMAFVMLQRLMTPADQPLPPSEQATRVEWASTSLFYEGAKLEFGFHDDDLPHPLDS